VTDPRAALADVIGIADNKTRGKWTYASVADEVAADLAERGVLLVPRSLLERWVKASDHLTKVAVGDKQFSVPDWYQLHRDTLAALSSEVKSE
jgi:hypothetical protein